MKIQNLLRRRHEVARRLLETSITRACRLLIVHKWTGLGLG